jgi:hypothetical protein
MKIRSLNNLDSALNSFARTQTKFDSTKALYDYAKKRIVGVAKKFDREYLVVADTQKNEILFERLGERQTVNIENWLLPNMRRNLAIMHGHTRNGYPLSSRDCMHLFNNEYDKVIAFDKRGRFSLLQRLPNSDLELAKEIIKYEFSAFRKALREEPVLKRVLKYLGITAQKHENSYLKARLNQSDVNMRYISNMY